MEYSAFEEATVPICTFVLRNAPIHYTGNYLRLSDFKGGMDVQRQKVLEAQETEKCAYRFSARQDNFEKIPGAPVAYWVSEKLFAIFNSKPKLSKFCEPKQGLITGDNDRFLKLWFEVNGDKVALNGEKGKKWVPINKGGEYRKWYGNHEYIVNWENDGYEIKNFFDEKGKLKSRPQNLDFNFRDALSWSLVTSGGFSVRMYDKRFAFNVAGISCFPDKKWIIYLNGLLNCKIVSEITQILNPTLNMNAGDVAKVPIIIEKEEMVEKKHLKQLKHQWRIGILSKQVGILRNTR